MSKTTTKPRVRVPRAEREAQMLAVAERVFAERGFQAATMDEIAEQVGITKPLIYGYFGSKEGLLAATVENTRRELIGVLIAAWRDNAHLEPRERLRSVFVAFFELADERERLFALVRGEGSLIGEAAASVERLRHATAKALSIGLESTGRTATDLTLMAEVVIGGAERLAARRVENPELTIDAAADIVLATVWDGLGTTGLS